MSLTPEQRAMRIHTIGASEVASAIGLNPWRSPHHLWCLKRGLIDDEENIQTRVGELVEPVIRQLYAEETGAEIGHFGTIVHPEHPWLSATPDGLIHGVSRGCEFKCVGYRMAHHFTDKPDGIPDYYRTQVEQCMAVTGAEEWDVAALIGGTDFRIYRIKRDPELWGKIYARARRFWYEHVIPGVPPTPDSSEGARQMLVTLFPRSARPVMQRATPDVDTLGEQLIKAKADVEAAEARAEALANRLRAAIGDAEGIRGETWRATWKSTKAGTRQFLFKAKEQTQ